LLRKDPSSIRNIYEVELHVRFYLLENIGSLKPDEANEELLDTLESFYFVMERRFPNKALLQIFIAQYYITYKKSLADAVTKMNSA
jgi:hypothetical protein